MGEQLDRFIEEQKAKLAQDKSELEKDPPYMEIRRKWSFDGVKPQLAVAKENIPPNWQSQKDVASVKQTGDSAYGLSLPLGDEYERKKHKLKEELRRDYRQYLNQGNAQAKRKKHLRSTGEVNPNTQGMSLPIGERLSAKERLRLERNQEYNQFLRMKEDDHHTFRTAAAAHDTRADKPVVMTRVNPEEYSSLHMTPRDYPPTKDAATSMEAYEELLNKRRSEEDRYRRFDVEIEAQGRTGRKGDEELYLNKRNARSHVDADMKARPRYYEEDSARRPLRLNLDSNIGEDIPNNMKYEGDLRDKRQTRYSQPPDRMLPRRTEFVESRHYGPEQASYFQVQRSDNRDRRDREPSMAYEDDFREQSKRRPSTSLTNARQKAENTDTTIERSKSANLKEESFSTGLVLGGSDREEAQRRRKERYRQDLMEQIAEQQRNKKREKELELKVAASGAIDPEKQPDRLRQFGAVDRQQEVPERNVPYRPGVAYDAERSERRFGQRPSFEERAPPERVPPERPRVAFQTPAPEAAGNGGRYPEVVNPVSGPYHLGLANALGEIVVPRIASIPPPQPPILTDNYKTPYDDAYYFYGARNPLDPNLAYYHPGTLGPPSAPGVTIPVTQMLQPDHHFGSNREKPAEGRGTSLDFFHEDKPRLSKENNQSYQEALQRQIQEKNVKRREEKEEQERYDAKLEVEMRNYNPWGKGGGGAPLKDSHGNLITDLKRMHKHNEDPYQQPDAKPYEDKRSVVAVDPCLADNSGSTSKIPDFASSSPYARGSVFGEAPSEQQVHQQETYKNFLRQQIEEKRRKEEEERERIRLEEEREEKRLAEQRAKIQREFEEEQNKKKLKEEEQRQKNEELVRLADERRKEAERKRKEEEEKHEEELRRYYEQEKSAKVTEKEEEEEEERPPRQPSPVIPTLQNKVSARAQRPPTTESQISARSHAQPQSRAVSPPVPARRNQLRAYDEKKNVISELSELRKQLRSEQRRLEGRLHDADRDDDSSPSMSGRRREKNPMDVFDLARQKLQATVRRPSLKGTDNNNTQNIREFNDLKYRDTDTREGVRFMYPDPPKDDQTLDIQQQALLREQQRNLNRLKRRPWMLNDLEPAPVHGMHQTGTFKDSSNDLMRTSLLESESAFIGENGEPFPAFAESPADFHPVPSARERRRHKQKSPAYENDIPLVPALPLRDPDRFSVNSDFSLNVDDVRNRNEERLRRLSNLQKSSRTIDDEADVLGDAEDFLKLFPAKTSDRPRSVDTVATDPWLRPGTSDTLKRFMAGQLGHDNPAAENALAFNWQGLSTAHG
ncbi:centrosome and spindle pole-associated protein 1 isoform X2 [Spea bombifrons]|uniref:centrosome and spindle pole-associated protein 1 isoform X2 n=1 Tax=Spea bombifrons TaxID=233779 RepID=UPI00234B3EFF|nr:centrosome and spindle pole-associated protein 1 isoform X2 [Spea bombifrons]